MGPSPSVDLEKRRDRDMKNFKEYLGFFYGWYTHPQVTDNISIDRVYINLLSCGYLRRNGISYPNPIASILEKYLINLKYILKFKHNLVSFHTHDGIFIHNQSINSLLQFQSNKDCQSVIVKMFIQLKTIDCDYLYRLFRFGLIGIPKTDSSYNYSDEIAQKYQNTFEKMINTTIQPKLIHKNTLLFSRISEKDRKFTKHIVGHYIVTLLESSTNLSSNVNINNQCNNYINCLSYYCMFDDIGSSLCQDICIVDEKKNNKIDGQSVFKICVEKCKGGGYQSNMKNGNNEMNYNLYFNQNGETFCLNQGEKKAMKIELDFEKYCYYFAISTKYCNCMSKQGIVCDVKI